MADTFTPNAKIRLPANNDGGWDVLTNNNWSLVDAQAAIGWFAVTTTEVPSTTLNVAVAAGTFISRAGAFVTYAGTASQAMTASTTNYVYLTDAGALTVNNTGFPASTNIVPLAVVVAGTASITSITDARRPFHSAGGGPVINSSSGTITADTDGATITFDCGASNMHSVTLGGNRTLAVTGDSTGQWITVILTQDATGSRTVTWWSGIRWPGGSAPALTATAGKKDAFRILKTGAGAYLGFILGQNL